MRECALEQILQERVNRERKRKRKRGVEERVYAYLYYFTTYYILLHPTIPSQLFETVGECESAGVGGRE